MTRIFNLIDAERKIMGFAVSEIVCSAFLMVIGFAFDMLFFSIIALFSSVFIMRYIKYLLKKSGFLKRLFFVCSDLFFWRSKTINYYRKYYI
ncbi:MAG: hypothetical protein ACRY3E_04640 [Candidatus Lariskella arthropodorum]